MITALRAFKTRTNSVLADGGTVLPVGDRYGRQTMAGIEVTPAPVDVTNSGDTSLIAAPGAGLRIKLLRCVASNTHATTALTVGLKAASLAGGAVFGKQYLLPTGGLAVWQVPGGHFMLGVNEALFANLSAAGTVSYTAYYEVVAD